MDGINLRFDFDPIEFPFKVRLHSTGRNRRLALLVALRGEFDIRALFLFAHFLFGQAKRKWAIHYWLIQTSGLAQKHVGINFATLGSNRKPAHWRTMGGLFFSRQQ
jgi:hypothetical protein